MAPEQLQHKPVSIQSDIYSLGVTMYEAFTRRQPFRAANEDGGHRGHPVADPAAGVRPESRGQPADQPRRPQGDRQAAVEPLRHRQRVFGHACRRRYATNRSRSSIRRASSRGSRRRRRRSRKATTSSPARSSRARGRREPDPQISVLGAQIDLVGRQKTVTQLLDSARARYEEDEDPLALQKIRKCCSSIRPTSARLVSRPDRRASRRRQFEKWIMLARQHADNQAYATPATRCRTRWCSGRDPACHPAAERDRGRGTRYSPAA